MKISIVMPVYNSEEYVGKAIDSILAQSFQDFELILVDDCATDGSPAICDEYAAKDARVRVHHSEQNGGICKARNKGMELARGEYIAFCDDDDDFLPGLLEENIKLAEQYDADMVKFGRRLIDVLKDDTVIRTKETQGYGLHVYRDEEKYTEYYKIRSRGYLTNLWNGIYKLSTIRENDIVFNEKMRYGSEDMDFSLRLFEVGSCIVINPETYYVHYRRDASSTSRKFNRNKIASILKTAEHEMPIWERMPDTRESRIQRDQMASDILRNIITIQLLHENCPYSRRQKKQVVARIARMPQLSFGTDRAVNFEVFKRDKKSWATIILCKYHCYGLLIDLLKVYRKYFGDKWN